jgi:hypothetical protein
MFHQAIAFRTTIASWNTASVSMMTGVTPDIICIQACHLPSVNHCHQTVIPRFRMHRCGARHSHTLHTVSPALPLRLCGAAVAFICSQMFYIASAFNDNIGGWDTASVSTMYNVWFLPCMQCERSAHRALIAGARPACIDSFGVNAQHRCCAATFRALRELPHTRCTVCSSANGLARRCFPRLRPLTKTSQAGTRLGFRTWLLYAPCHRVHVDCGSRCFQHRDLTSAPSMLPACGHAA